MRYDRIYKAKFIERPNRFIAYAELNGKKETVHVKNTGRCAELLRPGADIYIQESDNPSRKTRWDLIAVKKGSRMINMDSQIPNKVVKEWIEQGNLFGNVTLIRPETVYKNSRFDLYVEAEDQNGGIRKIFIEIKGVTLEENGVCRFPDAPSVRAFFVLIRHEFQKICGLAVQNGAQLVQNVQRNMLDGVVVHARQSGLANPSHCDQILLFDAFFGKHGFQLDANHVSTSLFFTISHLPENCNAFRKNIYEKCCFTIDIQRNSLYNIDIERRLRGAREQPKGGDAP